MEKPLMQPHADTGSARTSLSDVPRTRQPQTRQAVFAFKDDTLPEGVWMHHGTRTFHARGTSNSLRHHDFFGAFSCGHGHGDSASRFCIRALARTLCSPLKSSRHEAEKVRQTPTDGSKSMTPS